MLKKIKVFLTPLNIFAALIILIAFFLRVYRVGDILGFYYDQGRDALVIWDLINSHKFFLIGPTTGIAGIFRGPFYYYLIAPFYALSGGSPVLPDIFLAFLSTLALALIYFLSRKIGGGVMGIIALIIATFSFEIIYASRWLSNPTPMLLLSMILVYLMFLVYEGKKWAWALISAVLGISLFHFGSSGEVFYFPAVFIFAIWMIKRYGFGTKKGIDWKVILVSVGLFLITFSPLFIFNLKHDGILSSNIQSFLIGDKSFGDPTPRFILDRLSLMGSHFGALIFHSIYEKEIIILSLIGVYTLYVLSGLLKNDKFKIISLLFISPIIGTLFFQGNFGNLYSYYFTGYYLIFIIFIAGVLSNLFEKNILGKLLVTWVLVLFFIPNWALTKGFLTTKGDESNQIIFLNQKNAIEWIYNNSKGHEFNVDVYVPPVIPYAYDYLFKWYPKSIGLDSSKHTPTQTQLLYTLHEIDSPHPERREAWLKRQDGIGKVEETANFGGITVEKRTRIK